jgi:hypothetical protein
MIDRAVALNANAHFGREKYQKHLAEYVATQVKAVRFWCNWSCWRWSDNHSHPAIVGPGLAMMRLARLAWPFPFFVRLGWLTSATPNRPVDQATARVILLRGAGIVFSSGFGTLCNNLRQQGVWTEDLRCQGDLWATRQIAAEQRAGTLRGPIIFVGHSCGGRAALRVARALQQAGVVIDLVICLDVAFPPMVPGNVKSAVNLFLGGWRLYPAGRLRVEAGSATNIQNIDLRGPDSPLRPRWLNHLNFTNSSVILAFVQDCILRSIAMATPG